MNKRKRSKETQRIAREIAGQCVGVRLRMLNRAMSRIYDEQLRPHGVKFSQMNILTTVSLCAPVRPGEVARILQLEKSTLSRNVKIMEDSGWLTSRVGVVGNSRLLRLTDAGRRLLREAAPGWRIAQQRVMDILGESTTEALRNAVDDLTRSRP